jgi:hypothetical protein
MCLQYLLSKGRAASEIGSQQAAPALWGSLTTEACELKLDPVTDEPTQALAGIGRHIRDK